MPRWAKLMLPSGCLKLGIHVMHGIPRKAVNKTNAHMYTVLGNGAQVSTLSNETWCDWNRGWDRVDMSKPGACQRPRVFRQHLRSVRGVGRGLHQERQRLRKALCAQLDLHEHPGRPQDHGQDGPHLCLLALPRVRRGLGAGADGTEGDVAAGEHVPHDAGLARLARTGQRAGVAQPLPAGGGVLRLPRQPRRARQD